MSTHSKLLKIVLPLLILLLGFGAARFLVAQRPEPQREVRENPGALVEVLTVQRGAHQVQIHGTGTVQPRQQVEITPQVGGRVVEVAPQLVAGGFFHKGELLFRIEEIDHRLAVDKARAALSKAEYELATVQGQARVARQEWTELALQEGEEANPLVLFEPQVKNARAGLLAAEAALRQAELDLQRTAVRAPFAGVLRSVSADLGQVVRSGTPVAVLAGTAQAEIVVPLPLSELDWLQVPRSGSKTPGSAAMVQMFSGGQLHQWPGQVVRSLGEVDPQGRMARVVVAIDDPYGLQGGGSERPKLAVGTFVQVVLQGRSLSQVATLPAEVLRDDDHVWVMHERQLQIRPVQVLYRNRDQIIIGDGLQDAEQVVLTNIVGAAEGLKLRPTEAVVTGER
jgi:RND family efflux transporter MFP subunit